LAIQKISDVLKMQFNEDTKDFRNAKEIQINKFQKQKEEIEQERKNYRREALKMGYNREEIEETTKDMDDTIKLIESQIIELSDNTDMEKYLEKLPEVLLKTVELASNTINRANLEGLREDIKLLLEITTVELTVTNKKELKVKLFDVLDKLVSSDNFNLERLSRKVRTTQILLYTKNYVSIPIHSKIVKENNRGLWKTRVEIV
jgi:hypothetical protein